MWNLWLTKNTDIDEKGKETPILNPKFIGAGISVKNEAIKTLVSIGLHKASYSVTQTYQKDAS